MNTLLRGKKNRLVKRGELCYRGWVPGKHDNSNKGGGSHKERFIGGQSEKRKEGGVGLLGM